MWVLGTLFGVALILLALLDAFEAILQPRRVTHRFRYARLFYQMAWTIWRAIAPRIRAPKRRHAFFSTFGPLSLIGLFSTWVIGLIVGFALVHWSLGDPLQPASEPATLFNYLYLSGTTLITLGFGDVTPTAPLGRTLAVVESALGFAFLAIIVGYLPVLYQAYSSREVTISLMDARAGSPPSAAEVLLRASSSGDSQMVDSYLAAWEKWAAELLESHLSFPVLSYYRSQHDNQSWLAALVTMLDTCAVQMVYAKDKPLLQSQLTFAMARHAAVDLALVLKIEPSQPSADRLPPAQLEAMLRDLREAIEFLEALP